jgi:ArsR family transcriptional regulator, arsenate/arsenite/antimonite-responsive transcriptional repressor
LDVGLAFSGRGSQPTVSHHLKVLRAAGIVDSERRGLWAFYYVKPRALDELAGWLF